MTPTRPTSEVADVDPESHSELERARQSTATRTMRAHSRDESQDPRQRRGAERRCEREGSLV